MPETDNQPYAQMPERGPVESRLGSAIISLVEPHLGHEAEYNRWYEDDHLIVSAMACPWVFAGKRWVATRPLRALRFPVGGDAAMLDRGCYLAAYWIVEGRYDEFLTWARSLVATRLIPAGRMSPARTHVFTNDQQYVGGVYRDAHGPRDVHALDYPFAGLVLQTIDAGSAAMRPELERWLAQEHVPALIAGSPASMCLIFRTSLPPKPRASITWYDRRLTLLWFFEASPVAEWPHVFADEERAIAETTLGTVSLVAPFIPVLPGTNRYVDELR